jgi:hypothetical protein
MADETVARDRRVFAPVPQRITFEIDGQAVETDLYNFLDLPVKDSVSVYTLEDEMRASEGGFAAMTEYMQKILALLCPKLEPDLVAKLVPRQLQEAIAASHGVTVPLPVAGTAPVPASPSPSAGSTTPAPPASAGGPSTSN